MTDRGSFIIKNSRKASNRRRPSRGKSNRVTSGRKKTSKNRKSSRKKSKQRRIRKRDVYEVVISQTTLDNIVRYQTALSSGRTKPGLYLNAMLNASGKPVGTMTVAEFIDAILSTKKPTCATDSIKGSAKDWNNTEIAILGDINVAVPVTIYDNGVWDPSDRGFSVHARPVKGELLYTCGALLKSGFEFVGEIPDLAEVAPGGVFNQARYNALVERRLLPLFAYANAKAGVDGKLALITIPGIGAGVFAGKFSGKMGEHLNIALKAMLSKRYQALNNIGLVYYDPFDECANEQIIYGGQSGNKLSNVEYRVRPQMQGNLGKTQLSDPTMYEESGDDFSNFKLYKIVAWNHVALPGNGYFVGNRWTDDAVAAAATDSMKGLLGVSGRYDKRFGMYLPPRGYTTWSGVVKELGFHLTTIDKLLVTTNSGELYKFTG